MKITEKNMNAYLFIQYVCSKQIKRKKQKNKAKTNLSRLSESGD